MDRTAACVLLGQHLGRHHQRSLMPALDRPQQRRQRHHRLARPDVALQQAVHGERPGQVGHDHGQGLALGPGQREGQGGQEPRHQGAVFRPGYLRAARPGGGWPGRCARRPAGAGPAPAGAGGARRRRGGGAPARPRPSSRVRAWPGRPRFAPTGPTTLATPRAAGPPGRRPAPAPPRRRCRSPNWSGPPWPTPGRRAGCAGCGAGGPRPAHRPPPPRRPPGSPSGAGNGIRRPCPRRWPRSPRPVGVARHGWLKKTTPRVPVSSRTDRSTTMRPLRARRDRTRTTSASTAAGAPTSRPDTSACAVRSM